MGLTPHLQRNLPGYFEADHKWLEGMTLAAQHLGLEIQYCMACGHQALDSLRWPSVTNMRANGDGGLDVPKLAYSSLLQGALGLGFSKDNLRLSNCSVPPCHGAYSHYAGSAQLQTLLAALSLGPVGLADQLTGHPSVGVDVNTNVTLARSTASLAGYLLQPSFPLTPIDPCIAGDDGLSPATGNVWATYTAVSGVVWWTVVGWGWDGSTQQRQGGRQGGSQPPAPPPLTAYTVLPEHLLGMVDANVSMISGDFSAVPRGGFMGSGGTEMPLPYVSWDAHSSVATAFSREHGALVNLHNHMPHQVNIAPVVGGVALLGEKGKAAAVSTYRFTLVAHRDVSVNRDGGIMVLVRGEANESVELLFATADSGFKVQSKVVVLGAAGELRVALPPTDVKDSFDASPLEAFEAVGGGRNSVARFNPAGRFGHCTFVVGGKLYSLGGECKNSSTLSDEFMSFDPATGTWMLLNKDARGDAPPGIVGHACTADESFVYVTGGNTHTNRTSKTWTLDLTTPTSPVWASNSQFVLPLPFVI